MTFQTVADKGVAYEVTLTNGTVLWVPKDSLNMDYVRIQNWVAAGGITS